ncbi:MAG: peptide deformylase [Nitrospinales bacterium]
MAALKIAKLGNPILRQIAKPVDLNELTAPNSEIQVLIDDMVDTMHKEGGVGLAAPQVSRSLQIAVIESFDNKRYADRPDISLTTLVNPEIIEYSEEQVFGWESCLSLIDFRGLVPRSKTVTVEAYDRRGEKKIIEAEGFLAVVLQHEIDHLNGMVFLDRMPDLAKLSYEKEFETYWVDKPEELVEA